MQKTPFEHTDRDLLVSTLIHAIMDAELRLRRNPTKQEVLDQLFSEARNDPEARELAKKLDLVLATLLEDWDALDDWDREGA